MNQNQQLMNSRNGQSSFPRNDFFIKPKYQSKTRVESLKSDGKTSIRPITALDESGQPAPFRNGPELNDFGLWFRFARVVRFFGKNKFSFALEEESYGRSPAAMLFHAHEAAKKNPTAVPRYVEWATEVGGTQAKGDYGTLRRPDEVVFLPAIVLNQGAKIHPEPLGLGMADQMLPTVLLPRTAYLAMLDPYLDPEQRNITVADPIDFNSGAICTFHMPGRVQQVTAPQQGQVATYGMGGNQQHFAHHGQRQSTQEKNSYVCEIAQTVLLPNGFTHEARGIGQYFQSHLSNRLFDVSDAIDLLDPERQMEMVKRAGFPSSLLQHAFQSTEWWGHLTPHQQTEGFRPTFVPSGYGAPQQPLVPQPGGYGYQGGMPPAADPQQTTYGAAPGGYAPVATAPYPAPMTPPAGVAGMPLPPGAPPYGGSAPASQIPQYGGMPQAADPMAAYHGVSPAPAPGGYQAAGAPPVPPATAHAGLASHVQTGDPLQAPPQANYLPPVQAPVDPNSRMQPMTAEETAATAAAHARAREAVLAARRAMENPTAPQG